MGMIAAFRGELGELRATLRESADKLLAVLPRCVLCSECASNMSLSVPPCQRLCVPASGLSKNCALLSASSGNSLLRPTPFPTSPTPPGCGGDAPIKVDALQ